MEETFKTIVSYFVMGAEACAALVIVIALIEALAQIVQLPFKKDTEEHVIINIRIRMGKWLTLALEFALAAGIIETTIAPTWNEIGKLAAIAALRTILNYFLEKEVERASERDKQKTQ